ncbi:MAG: hypothetical protein WC365_04245 [Candidatus Babeliales bacterium]|jgi:hypothetical protein
MTTSGTATITAGNDSVIVEHTYGDDDFVVVWNTSRDVGTVTITDKSSTQFTITISNIEFEEDTSIAWAITTGIREADTLPSANQYCTISNVLAMPDVPGYQELNFDSQANYETYVSRLVDRASRHIDRYCKRPNSFFNGGASITEYQNGEPYQSGVYSDTVRAAKNEVRRKLYHLGQSPIISISSVAHNNNSMGASPVWDTTTDYQLDTETGEISFASSVTINDGIKNLRFVYVAGYASVPDEVEQACEELVANAIKKATMDNLNARVRFGKPSAISMTNKEVFTDEIKEMLEPYKQVRI